MDDPEAAYVTLLSRDTTLQCLIRVEQKPVASREETLVFFLSSSKKKRRWWCFLFLFENKATASSPDKNAAAVASVHVFAEQQAHSAAADARRLYDSALLAGIWTVLV